MGSSRDRPHLDFAQIDARPPLPLPAPAANVLGTGH
jgi:hypothetical protein